MYKIMPSLVANSLHNNSLNKSVKVTYAKPCSIAFQLIKLLLIM